MPKYKIGLGLLALIVISIYAKTFDECSLNCSNNDAEACFQAAKVYVTEVSKIKNVQQVNINKKIAQLYKKSCELGYAKGCMSYAMNFRKDLEKDSKLDSLYYFQKACDLGEDAACNVVQMKQFKK